MFRFFLVTVFLPALVLGQATSVRECKSHRKTFSTILRLRCKLLKITLFFIGTDERQAPVEVRVEGCTTAPCNIFQGFDAIMQIDFRAPALANTLRPVVMATALGVTIEYPLDPSFNDACNHLIGGSFCPLAANEDATYNFVFHVASYYPPIAVAVELSLIDHAGNHVFCSVIDIHVRIS